MAHTNLRPGDVISLITQHRLRIVVPTVVFTILALGYALLRPASWEVSQALVVRDEAGDRLTRPGKFAHTDEMKAAQETILELVKSRNVLSKALVEAGPSNGGTADALWPSDQDVESLQASIKVAPPKGAEFGKTEVFYLKVKDRSHGRARQLALAVCHQLQRRFSELQEAKAASTVDELNKTLELAKADLATATRPLSEIEQRVSSDLGELRILSESPSGDSDLRRTATDLEKELRTYRAVQTENEELLKLLSAAQADPGRLVASPSVLLKSQPALGRLKDGLVDAQLKLGNSLGTMSEAHPNVRVLQAAEQAVRQQLHGEIGVAIRGVQVDLKVNADKIRALEEQDKSLKARFAALAAVRADYANLVAAVKNRGEHLKAVEHDLAEAQASQVAAQTSSVISLVDTPDGGTRPSGPSKAMIVLAGLGGGLAFGLGLLLVTIPPTNAPQGGSEPEPVHTLQWSAAKATLMHAFERAAKYRTYAARSN